MNGKVKRLVTDGSGKSKGFGFLAADDGVEYFFHRSAVRSSFDQLREGDAVTFDVGRGPKGPRADNVEPV